MRRLIEGETLGSHDLLATPALWNLIISGKSLCSHPCRPRFSPNGELGFLPRFLNQWQARPQLAMGRPQPF